MQISDPKVCDAEYLALQLFSALKEDDPNAMVTGAPLRTTTGVDGEFNFVAVSAKLLRALNEHQKLS